jgi:hypothetical protein
MLAVACPWRFRRWVTSRHLRGIALATSELRRAGVCSSNRRQERGEMPAFAEIVCHCRRDASTD